MVAFCGLDFQEHFSSHQQVGEVVAHDNSFVLNTHGELGFHRESTQTQLMSQCVLKDFFQKPSPQGVGDSVGTTDDSLGQGIELSFSHGEGSWEGGIAADERR